MTILASDIISDARAQLIDTGSQPRWTDAELLGYISDGLRTMVTLTPSITALKAVVQLAAGARQTIPANGYMLLELIRNMGLAGTSAGRACRIVNREVLDAHRPAWTADNQSPTVQNYVYDPIEPKVYYVYPPSSGAGYVEMVYSQAPVQLTATSDALPIDDMYRTAVLYYTLFRAHSKDNDFGSATQAGNFLQLFMAFMGQARSGDLAESPNQQLTAPDLATRGAAK